MAEVSSSVRDLHPDEPAAARTAVRPLAILETIADASADGITLAELSQTLSIPKSTLLTVLRPLVRDEFLKRVDQRYLLDLQSVRLARSIMRVHRFSGAIREVMQDVWHKSKETVILVGLDPDAQLATYLDCINSPQNVRYVVPTGTVRPLYASAGALALLAFQENRWLEAYLRTVRFHKYTALTLDSEADLRGRIAEIRRSGVSVSEAEMVPGAMGIAVPLPGDDGEVRKALLVAGPLDRMKVEEQAISELLLGVAQRVSIPDDGESSD
jgi:DNA-binding IclR family transcriptional regulator